MTYSRAALWLGLLTGLLTPNALVHAETPFDHSLFTEVLQEHVKNGQVDYAALKADDRLATYLASLADANLATMTDERASLAFWINAYNAYTLRLITSAYPVKTIKQVHGLGVTGQPDDRAPWEASFAQVGGRTYSLNQIEHEVIRKQFKDARVHFALVCAARSCAPLRSEAYVAEKLDEQLDLQTRWFVRWRNDFNLQSRSAGLSPIFDWYREDFGGSDAALLHFIAGFAPTDLSASLHQHAATWKVTFMRYDWALNDRQ